MAAQSLYQFSSLKALLDFRKAHSYDSDSYIYCKGLPEGFAIQGQIISGKKQFLLFAPKNAPLDATSLKGGTTAYLLIYWGLRDASTETLDHLRGGSPFLSLSTEQSACIETVLSELLPGQQELRNGLFISFLELLLDRHAPTKIPDTGHYGRRLEIAHRFMALVQQEATQHHGVQYYADVLCISSSYLSKCVQEAVHLPAKKFIISVLLEHAQKLLRDSGATIVAISEVLGFDISSDFTAFFKQHSGHTPSTYRRLQL